MSNLSYKQILSEVRVNNKGPIAFEPSSSSKTNPTEYNVSLKISNESTLTSFSGRVVDTIKFGSDIIVSDKHYVYRFTKINGETANFELIPFYDKEGNLYPYTASGYSLDSALAVASNRLFATASDSDSSPRGLFVYDAKKRRFNQVFKVSEDADIGSKDALASLCSFKSSPNKPTNNMLCALGKASSGSAYVYMFDIPPAPLIPTYEKFEISDISTVGLHSVCVDDDGCSVYFAYASSESNRKPVIYRYNCDDTPSGPVLLTIDGSIPNMEPEALAVFNGYLYISDYNNSTNYTYAASITSKTEIGELSKITYGGADVSSIFEFVKFNSCLLFKYETNILKIDKTSNLPIEPTLFANLNNMNYNFLGLLKNNSKLITAGSSKYVEIAYTGSDEFAIQIDESDLQFNNIDNDFTINKDANFNIDGVNVKVSDICLAMIGLIHNSNYQTSTDTVNADITNIINFINKFN